MPRDGDCWRPKLKVLRGIYLRRGGYLTILHGRNRNMRRRLIGYRSLETGLVIAREHRTYLVDTGPLKWKGNYHLHPRDRGRGMDLERRGSAVEGRRLVELQYP